MPLIDRLRLAKDLLTAGRAQLHAGADDATAIQGIVHVDLAFDIAARAALDHVGRAPQPRSARRPTDFGDVLAAFPELGAHATPISQVHQTRNSAQHGGTPPSAGIRQQLRDDATVGVEIAFRLAGHDYWAFSSVPQIRSRYLRELLEGAQGMASLRPDDAAAVTMIAFERLRGWAEEVLGDFAIPDQMWIHSGHRAEDAFGMMSCADKRHEFVHAMLRLSATTVLKMSAASWVRLFTICRGHHVRVGDEALVFEHDATAAPVTQAQIAWAIETVARATLALELEWPDLVLGDEPKRRAEDPRLPYAAVTIISRGLPPRV
jgi:hypothetical protein